MTHDLLNIELRTEQDVVSTRQRAREIAALLGLKPHDQTSLATAVSELARHAHRSGTAATAAFKVRVDLKPALVIALTGRGIEDESSPDATIGVSTARRLVDEYDIQSSADTNSTVTIAKRLPRGAAAVTAALLASITAALARQLPRDPIVEVQQQNRELMLALDELQKRQAEVERLNSELAETNRGVLALYAELDEKAESLRRASEHKTRFLSDMTHELRTPLNAMISLSHLLLDRVDGELTAEQERQVSLISRSAISLNEMVSDLLDIARIEAGKEDVRVSEFAVADLLAALRGMFRPLTPSSVTLLIDDPVSFTMLNTDERKLTQILRNLLSNAVKFTASGTIALRATASGATVEFVVSDTGIGIDEDDLAGIFADFTQVDSPLQRKLRGTGLGLPLTRKLARLLGGNVTVTSIPGSGSIFAVTLPRELEPNVLKQTFSMNVQGADDVRGRDGGGNADV